MGTRTKYEPGTFSYVDLFALDPKKAEEFYGKVFGWKSVKQDTQDGPPYWQYFQDHDSGNGMNPENVAGMGQLQEELIEAGVPSFWNSYVTVEDINVSCEKVEKLGGSITMPPVKIHNSGHMAIIQDKEGALLSLWQPLNHIGATLVNVPGSLCWNDIGSKDLDLSVPFYESLFGWTIKGDKSEANPYLSILNKERSNGGIMKAGPEMAEIPVSWNAYFAIKDIEGFKKKVVEAGGKLHSENLPVADVGFMVFCEDSQGAFFIAIEMKIADD